MHVPPHGNRQTGTNDKAMSGHWYISAAPGPEVRSAALRASGTLMLVLDVVWN